MGSGTYRLILGIRFLAIAAFLLLIASPIALAVFRPVSYTHLTLPTTR